MTEQLLSTRDAGKLLGVSHDTVYRMCKRGDLPFVEVGKPTEKRAIVRMRVPRPALDTWVEAHTKPAKTVAPAQ